MALPDRNCLLCDMGESDHLCPEPYPPDYEKQKALPKVFTRTVTYRIKRTRLAQLPPPPGLRVNHRLYGTDVTLEPVPWWRMAVWTARYRWAQLLDRWLGEPRQKVEVD